MVGLSGIDNLLGANFKYTLHDQMSNPTGRDELNYNFSGLNSGVELLASGTVVVCKQNNLFIPQGTFGTSAVTFTGTPDNACLSDLGI